MTAPMTMNRLIHAAVRRDLDRLAAGLDTFRNGDVERARDLQRAFANLRRELTHHHEGEDIHIWPMLAGVGVSPELLGAMEAEHHAMAEALAQTDAAMSTFAASGSAVDAADARASVARTRAVVDQHLAHEENELEPQLLPHTESAEWKAVEKKLSRQPPGVAGPFFAWLTDGMSAEHQAFLRSTVPAPVVTVLARVFGRRYNREVAPVWRAGTR
jgi:hemerythrin-like domain-containing protein